MYLTEYWNDDDDDEEIVVLPHFNEQLQVVIDFEQNKKEADKKEVSST